jgi:hypothetical protein
VQQIRPDLYRSAEAVAISSAISNGLQAMNALSRYAAKQFAFALLETSLVFLVGSVINNLFLRGYPRSS